MGILWKDIHKKYIPDWSVCIYGDPKAFSKNNPLWYIQNKWRIIEVERDFGLSFVPCNVFFRTESLSMVCKKIVFTKRIAVRIGQEDLFFSMISINEGKSMKFKDLSQTYGLVELMISTNKYLARFFGKQHISDVTMI